MENSDHLDHLDEASPVGTVFTPQPNTDLSQLQTIDIDALKKLCENTTPPPLEEAAGRNPVKSGASQAMSDDLIKKLVSPRKLDKVKEILERSKEPHRCALDLLRHFFTKQELQKSNTDGKCGKDALNVSKLNSLKGV